MSFSFTLTTDNDTQRLGHALALTLSNREFSILLLKGTLGAGKTTLVRHIISALPNGGMAEVSSPSFTLMNIYDTTPPVKHFDLYRLDPYIYDENLDEALDDEDNAVFIEWAERIPERALPQEYLECMLTLEGPAESPVRKATFRAQGNRSAKALTSLVQLLMQGQAPKSM